MHVSYSLLVRSQASTQAVERTPQGFANYLPDLAFCSNLPLQSGSPPSKNKMATYEPKTDSREFDVSSTATNPATASNDPTDIAIRLWGGQSDRHAGPANWATDSVCVFMVADLIAASAGRVEESAGGMVAHFDGPGQAMVGARRVQTALLEFCSGPPGETVGAAILIHPAFGGPSLSAEAARTTLNLANPGQILLAEQIAKRWADIPGVEFREVQALSSAGIDHPGLVELMWTTPDQLDRLQASLKSTPSPPENPSLPVGATLIVHSPFGRSGTTGQSRSATTGLGDVPSAGRSDTRSAAETGHDSSLEQRGQDASSLLLQELEESRRFWTPTKAIVGVLAVTLVGALIAVLYWPVPESRHPRHVQQESVSGSSTPAPVPAVPEKQTPGNSAPAPSQPVETKSIESEKKVPPPVLPKPAPQKKQVNPQVISPPKPAPVPAPNLPSAWSKSDISQLLRMAQSAAGEGRYDDARAAYRKILQLQPDNQQAKDGLHKIELIKNDSDN